MFANRLSRDSLLSLVLIALLPGALPEAKAQQPILDINTLPPKHQRFTNPLPARTESGREQKFLRIGVWNYMSLWTPERNCSASMGARPNSSRTSILGPTDRSHPTWL